MFSIFLANVRGLRSKKGSLEKIIKKTKPSVVLLNETQLAGRMKCEILPLGWTFRNRGCQGGGGIATGVAQELKDTTIAAGEGKAQMNI